MTDFINNLSQFHFIRPLYLLAIPVMLMLWYLTKNSFKTDRWENHIPKEMLSALRVNNSTLGNNSTQALKLSIIIGLLCLAAAAAGPTWEKQAVPTLKNKSSMVVVLDLSPSMLAEDLTPNRLTRAKYKLIDIIKLQADGQVALIAYAGDAHTVSPLTDDPKSIEALLPALHPNVMPIAGSNTEAAVLLAQELLNDAGVTSGNILLLTDGVDPQAIENIENDLSSKHTLSVLAISGGKPTPIPKQGGGFLRNNRTNEIVLTSANSEQLSHLASRHSGAYALLTNDDSDIKHIINQSVEVDRTGEVENQNSTYDDWVDIGHWLVLLILPIAVFCFRKGLIYLLPLTLPLFLLPTSSTEAADFSELSKWFKTDDQQAQTLFNQEQYEQAAATFERDDWAAAANYKNNNYPETLKRLEGKTDTTSLYNKANTLALNGDLDQAIEAYEQLISQDKSHADAIHNKQVVEQLKQQQEAQENKQDQENSEGDKEDQSSQEQDQEKGQSENQQGEPSEQDEEAPEQDSETPQNSEQQQDQAEQQQSEQEKKTGEEVDNEDQSNSGNESDEEPVDESEVEKNELSETDEQVETQLKDSSEQWLRAIKDDPSGLLRRKFDYQTWQRQQDRTTKQRNSSAEQRY